jgi:hypothetical protein
LLVLSKSFAIQFCKDDSEQIPECFLALSLFQNWIKRRKVVPMSAPFDWKAENNTLTEW